MNKKIKSDFDRIMFKNLLIQMRESYFRGENAMALARKLTKDFNTSISTLIAYDLQAGSYNKTALENPQGRLLWETQLAKILNPLVCEKTSILEVGCGEATTLSGVLKQLISKPKTYLGFDISWSRCAEGLRWLDLSQQEATLFVADIFDIPLQDNSIDVVYTSHSLEPNGGLEEDALKELLRVARKSVVLIEPIFELADTNAKNRMIEHGYVKNLKAVAQKLGATICDYRLLDFTFNSLNPSGLILIHKPDTESMPNAEPDWRCPVTHAPLVENNGVFMSENTGLIYPVLGGIPMLRAEHVVVASHWARYA